MKKTIILFALVLIAGISFAQKGKVTSAQSLKDAGKLADAIKTIEVAIDPNNEKAESSISWPHTWEVRGEIFQAIFESKDAEVKKLESDPLTKALESYKKALELDIDKKITKSLKVKFTFLQPDITNQAVVAFKNQDFKLALQSFEQILEIEEIPFIKADNPNAIDTVILFNAGLSAYNAKDYDKAIKYYSVVAKFGFNEGRTYQQIASAYELKGDTTKSLETLQEGFQKYPSNATILTMMINLYITQNKTNEALKYLELAIKQDPNNASFHSAIGRLYDEIGQQANAIKSYETAIQLDSTNFIPYYNLGAIFYNEGVKQWDVAIKVPANDNKKYEEELAKCDIWWNKALPLMEKCHQLNSKDISTMESLKNLYFRLRAKDKATWEPKYQEMDAKLKNQ
jgi:tetratricopeptide (TPR) repeat protein